MRIHVLPDEIASKIAAGEVVERPASVVKELVENAIDAQSTAITVEIKNGGIAYIRVTDNGIGMERGDAEAAFLRHATSKISTAEDLAAVSMLGFRGEALYSIAAVSRVELTTRTAGAEAGTEVKIAGSKLESIDYAGCPEGTTIIVRNLFFNTPARLAFLKKIYIETGYVSDIMLRMILSHPEIAFKYVANGEIIYQSSGKGDLRDAIYAVYGRGIAASLLPVSLATPYASVSGFVGDPSIARSNRIQQSLFINGRFVRPGAISYAVQQAYDTRIMTGRFPFFALNITLPPNEVDVNVHPNKLEVRFRNEAEIKRLVTEAVSAALYVNVKGFAEQEPAKAESDPPAVPAQTEMIVTKPCLPTQLVFPERSVLKESAPGNDSGGEAQNAVSGYGALPAAVKTKNSADIIDGKSAMQTAGGEEGSAFETPVILGQAFATYLIVQKGEKLVIIDQHAAHERLLYNKFTSELNKGTASQQLAVPVIIELTHAEKLAVMENLPLFAGIGFEIEEFGPLSVSVRAVPVILDSPGVTAFFREFLDGIDDAYAREATAARRDRIISMSCKMAVKAGDRLSREEMEALLRDMESGEPVLTCPHGRPVAVVITKHQLEKMFKRIV